MTQLVLVASTKSPKLCEKKFLGERHCDGIFSSLAFFFLLSVFWASNFSGRPASQNNRHRLSNEPLDGIVFAVVRCTPSFANVISDETQQQTAGRQPSVEWKRLARFLHTEQCAERVHSECLATRLTKDSQSG